MSDVDAVIGLLERWRDASGMDRVRVGLDASRTIGGLPAARKRALATEVARRVAPQLVPAIESDTGDLSTEQVSAVIDLLRRADREQLDGLIGALRDGDVLGALELVDDAVDELAPPDPATTELVDDLTDEADEAPGPAATDEPDVDVAGHLELLDADEVEVAADGSLQLDEAAVREQLRREAAARAERWRDDSEATSDLPAYRAPAIDFGLAEDPIELPDPNVVPVAPLEDRLHELPGYDGGDGTVAAPALTTGPVTAVLAAITATPDGYRRRRAALEAIRTGRLEADDVPGVVASLARSTDRAWVAGAALDAGLLTAADLDALPLSPAATARLARRTG